MPDWFAAIAGDAFGPILWVIFVAVLVCGLAALSLLLLRKANGPGAFKGARISRLGVVEALSIGERRRLVLVRRDDVEHLILTGGSSDLVVETRRTSERSSPPEGSAQV